MLKRCNTQGLEDRESKQKQYHETEMTDESILSSCLDACSLHVTYRLKHSNTGHFNKSTCSGVIWRGLQNSPPNLSWGKRKQPPSFNLFPSSRHQSPWFSLFNDMHAILERASAASTNIGGPVKEQTTGFTRSGKTVTAEGSYSSFSSSPTLHLCCWLNPNLVFVLLSCSSLFFF